MDSEQGETLFFKAEANKAYFPLGLHFVTQDNPAFCGPASIAMVLNALHLPRPPSKLTLGLGLYDQENIFDARTEAVKPRGAVIQSGMTLDELGKILVAHDLQVTVHHAGESSLEEFRKLAVSELIGNDRFVLVNYLRSSIGQTPWDIFRLSPLTTETATGSLFSMYRATNTRQVWVEAQSLFAAMNTTDKDNGNLTRGYVIVGR